MSQRRAEIRREARRVGKFVAIIPGVMADRSLAARAEAMRVADAKLPPSPDPTATVTLALYTPQAGFDLIARTRGFAPDAADKLRAQLAELKGDEPTVVFATRAPRSMFTIHHERKP